MRTALCVMAVMSLVIASLFARTEEKRASGPAVTISGGHETDGRDRGRPVVLVAAGLGVPAEVFREAFTHVKPAGAGERPEAGQVQENKRALLSRLSKYGVTNERLDTVSNEYRYRPGGREIWKHEEAVVRATVVDGRVTGFVIEKAGSGYSSEPKISVEGFRDLAVKVAVHFDQDLSKNGSIEAVAVENEKAAGKP